MAIAKALNYVTAVAILFGKAKILFVCAVSSAHGFHYQQQNSGNKSRNSFSWDFSGSTDHI